MLRNFKIVPHSLIFYSCKIKNKFVFIYIIKKLPWGFGRSNISRISRPVIYYLMVWFAVSAWMWVAGSTISSISRPVIYYLMVCFAVSAWMWVVGFTISSISRPVIYYLMVCFAVSAWMRVVGSNISSISKPVILTRELENSLEHCPLHPGVR